MSGGQGLANKSLDLRSPAATPPVPSADNVDAPRRAAAPAQGSAGLRAVLAAYWPVVCLGFLTVLVLADTSRVLDSFGFRYTDDDISTFWYASQDFLHGHFREPFFYGQAYDTLAESLPGALLVGVGVRPAASLAVVSTAVGLLPWALLTVLAWRRGARNLALFISTGPLLLPVSYTMLLDKDFGSGVLAVTITIVLIESPGRAWRAFAFGFLLTAGIVILYPNAALVGVPAFVYVTVSRWGQWKAYALIGVGMACGVALDLAGQVFYWRNPGWVLHPNPPYDWDVHNVTTGLRSLDDFMSWFAPWFIPIAAVDLIGIGVIAVIVARRRNWSVAAAAVAAGVTSISALAFSKVHDGQTSVFFPISGCTWGSPS